jgi:hypothetical protein
MLPFSLKVAWFVLSVTGESSLNTFDGWHLTHSQ